MFTRSRPVSWNMSVAVCDPHLDGSQTHNRISERVEPRYQAIVQVLVLGGHATVRSSNFKLDLFDRCEELVLYVKILNFSPATVTVGASLVLRLCHCTATAWEGSLTFDTGAVAHMEPPWYFALYDQIRRQSQGSEVDHSRAPSIVFSRRPMFVLVVAACTLHTGRRPVVGLSNAESSSFIKWVHIFRRLNVLSHRIVLDDCADWRQTLYQ